MRPLPIAFLLAAAAAAATAAAGASPARAAPASVTLEHSTASLVAAANGWRAGAPLRLGLRLTLRPGWHTYWSNPGDAGLAPDVTVSLDGAKPVAAQLGFPAPARLPTGPLMGYGYEGEVLFPFTVTPGGTKGGPLNIAVHADWLVCASVCVPETADLALTLPSAAGVPPDPSPDAPLFARADQAMPRPSPFAATLSSSGLLQVAGDGIGPQSVRAAWFIPAIPGQIDQAAPQALAVSPGRLTLSLHPQPGLPAATPLAGVLALKDAAGQESDLLLTARRGDAVPITAGPAAPAPAGLAHLILLALVGGLILNLMPCVFPILAMKAVALGRHGRGEQSALRRSAAFYTVGILVSFLAIGIATLALRAAGNEAGWGFQFQSPVFVASMAWLLFAVGLNLAGLFEVGAGVIGAGSGLAARGGAFGDVMTGVLAVLVATPCTAPFMGAAVAAALAGPAIGGVAIFLALGLGLALPSLVIGFVPGVARLMPRPGAWMSLVRQVLAFPMFAASIWLFWVLTEETGADGVLAGLSGALLIAFAGWLYGLGQRGDVRTTGRRVLGVAALACVLVALSLLHGLTLTPAAAPAIAAEGGAEPFSEARLAALREAGRPVFVDMSAAWCITCLVNERVALDPASVRDAFAGHHVALLRGDWTRRDAAITRYLDHFGRNGVPLYVYYPAGGTPKVLPQILTPGLVTDLVGGSA